MRIETDESERTKQKFIKITDVWITVIKQFTYGDNDTASEYMKTTITDFYYHLFLLASRRLAWRPVFVTEIARMAVESNADWKPASEELGALCPDLTDRDARYRALLKTFKHGVEELTRGLERGACWPRFLDDMHEYIGLMVPENWIDPEERDDGHA